MCLGCSGELAGQNTHTHIISYHTRNATDAHNTLGDRVKRTHLRSLSFPVLVKGKALLPQAYTRKHTYRRRFRGEKTYAEMRETKRERVKEREREHRWGDEREEEEEEEDVGGNYAAKRAEKGVG